MQIIAATNPVPPFRLFHLSVTVLAFVIIFFALIPSRGYGEDQPLLEDEAAQQGKIDSTQQVASAALLTTAQWFDNFFDDNRFSAEENKSRAKLKLTLKYSEEDNEFDLRPRINWRIHLPKVSKKTNLIIYGAESDVEEDGFDTSDSLIDERQDRDNFGVAIQQFLKSGERYNVSTTFGASSSYVYGGLRFRYFYNLGSWQTRFVDRLRYYTDDGWENRASVDLERQVSTDKLFRASAIILWLEDDDSLPHFLNFRLFQHFSNDRAIAYEWFNAFETEPSHVLDNIQLQLRYRQRFFRHWLIYEIKPRVEFPRDNDREAEYSIYLTLEANFGNLETTKFRDVFKF